MDTYIESIIVCKDPFFLTDLGGKSFKALVRKANAYQRNHMLQVMLADPSFFLQNAKAFEFVCSKYKRSITDMNTEEERMQAFNICKEHLSVKIDSFIKAYDSAPSQLPALDLSESSDFIEILSEHIVPYATITNDRYDTQVIAFMLKFWDACTVKQFHLYHIQRYLNDFKFQVRERGGEDFLVEQVEAKQLAYLLQQVKALRLDTQGELELEAVEASEL